MKTVRPRHIIGYILLIFFFLGLMTYVIPPEGVRVGGWTLTFVYPEMWTAPEDSVQTEKVESILAHIDTSLTEAGNETAARPKEEAAKADSTEGEAQSISGLVFDSTGRERLYRFFKELKTNRGKLSILHYGDSQIESDRITGFLREKFQSRFGGYGPGLIPATEVYYMYAFRQTYSDNWTRYTAFGNGERLKSGKYGAMGSASRFTPEFGKADSTLLDSLPVREAFISIRPSRRAYARTRRYSVVKMHYNDCVAPVEVSVSENGKEIRREPLVQDGKQHTLTLRFERTPEELTFRFRGKISPNICGFSLEGTRGVQVSNIAMRGSDGTIFTRIRFSTLSGMMHDVNARLAIMQFGGNAVVVFRDSAHVRKYARWFQKQIERVRKAMPGSAIIVIGPSDMSKMVRGEPQTYPLLPYCVEQMEKAAVESGACFWNLYEAMGGKNSMPVWVEKELAAKDYVHFTGKGAKFAAQLFWEAFRDAYQTWEDAQDK